MRARVGTRLVRSIPLLLFLASWPSTGRAQEDPEPPLPGDATPSLCSDAEMCIEQLAGATVLNKIFTNTSGNSDAIQVTTFVWSARSFDRMADFYMVSQYVRSRIGPHDTQNWETFVENDLVSPDATALPGLVTSGIVPQASTCDTQIVNTNTTSFGGNVGLTTAGPEVSASTSSSWSQQTWTSCSSLQVVQGSPTRGINWDYLLQDQKYYDEAFVMAQQWVWEIPFTALAGPKSGISFQVRATIYVDDASQATGTFQMSVPAPFDEFSVPMPTLTGASPSTVQAGTVFTLSGTNLYPTGITELFIAGNAVDPALWFPVQDGKNEQVIVITPAGLATGQQLPIAVFTPGGAATGASIEVTP